MIEEVNAREERREQAEWERTRWLATVMLTPYAPKGKTLKPTDIARFPWEEAAKPKEISPHIQAIMDKWDKETK